MQDFAAERVWKLLIGGYYYKHIGSWEMEIIFWEEYFMVVWFLIIMDIVSESW